MEARKDAQTNVQGPGLRKMSPEIKAELRALVLNNFDETVLDPMLAQNQFDDWLMMRGKAGFRNICVPLTFVERGSEVIKANGFGITIATVIGFPHGNAHSTESKLHQVTEAAKAGAKEVDFVINISKLRSDLSGFAEELRLLSETAHMYHMHVKAIFETYYMSDEEIMKVASMCEAARIDFVKTSTGFAVKGKNHKERNPEKTGAASDAIALMGAGVKDKEKVGLKPSGGIRTLESLIEMRQAWQWAGWKDAQVRIGSSSGLQILEELKD